MSRMHRGFAVIEVLIVLCILCAMIPVTIVCLRPFSRMLEFDEEVQDEIALAQMRRILLLSYDIRCSSDSLQFLYQQKDWTLSCKNDHLVLSPGTQIFLSKIDAASFYLDGQCIFIHYTREGKEYEKVLCLET